MRIAMYGEQVRALRQEQGMTLRGLAAAVGVSRNTARRVERGQPVRVTTARGVARVLGVDPPQRLGRSIGLA